MLLLLIDTVCGANSFFITTAVATTTTDISMKLEKLVLVEKAKSSMMRTVNGSCLVAVNSVADRKELQLPERESQVRG